MSNSVDYSMTFLLVESFIS